MTEKIVRKRVVFPKSGYKGTLHAKPSFAKAMRAPAKKPKVSARYLRKGKKMQKAKWWKPIRP